MLYKGRIIPIYDWIPDSGCVDRRVRGEKVACEPCLHTECLMHPSQRRPSQVVPAGFKLSASGQYDAQGMGH